MINNSKGDNAYQRYVREMVAEIDSRPSTVGNTMWHNCGGDSKPHFGLDRSGGICRKEPRRSLLIRFRDALAAAVAAWKYGPESY